MNPDAGGVASAGRVYVTPMLAKLALMATLGLAVATATAQTYTYQSPRIVRLDRVRFQWKITGGWRLVTNAESSDFRAATMPFTLQRFNRSTHKLERQEGVFLFSTTAKAPKKKADAKIVEARLPLWGTDKLLTARLTQIPSKSASFWTKQLSGLFYMQKPGRRR